jgi:hypothetical protein
MQYTFKMSLLLSLQITGLNSFNTFFFCVPENQPIA